MRTGFLLLLISLVLSGCYYTRKGMIEDSERMGQKMQTIGQVLSGP